MEPWTRFGFRQWDADKLVRPGFLPAVTDTERLEWRILGDEDEPAPLAMW